MPSVACPILEVGLQEVVWVPQGSMTGQSAPSVKPLSGEPHLRVPPAAGHPLPLPFSRDPPNRRFEPDREVLWPLQHGGAISANERHHRGQRQQAAAIVALGVAELPTRLPDAPWR